MAEPWRWLMPWEPSVLVPATLILASALYWRGCRIHHPPWPRVLCFCSGMIGFYAVSFTRFDYYSEHVFFMHRLQHAMLHHMAPFLIALSRPSPVMAAGVPLPADNPVLRVLNHPAVAAMLFCGLILFWLIPSVHFIAMLDVRLYLLMNWSMALNGLMFWSLALNGTLPPGQRIAMMLAVIPPQIALGLVIFMTPHELYPIYSLCGRVLPLSPLADQQIGGLILWIPAAMTSVLGVIMVISREWFHPIVAADFPATSPPRAR